MSDDIRRPLRQTMERPVSKMIDKPSRPWQSLFFSSVWLGRMLLLAVIIILLAWWWQDQRSSVDYLAEYNIQSEWQAVFLDNGQTYFGQLKNVNSQTLWLDNVYYLQSQTPLQSGPQPKEGEIAIVKLGKEIHAPEAQMIIPTVGISYVENLKDTSAIVRAIKQATPGVE